MPNPFQTSTNALFDTRVVRVLRLSPGFVRITLMGDGLERFADHGCDQRIKIMVPGGPYPSVFDAAVPNETVPHSPLLHETVWAATLEGPPAVGPSGAAQLHPQHRPPVRGGGGSGFLRP